jgi:hypothetical protein
MNVETLIQNLITLFVVAIIIESAVMALFSLSSLRSVNARRPFEATRDGLIIILSFFLCYKVGVLSVFRNTGIAIPKLLDVVISALVLMRMTTFIWGFMSRLKGES